MPTPALKLENLSVQRLEQLVADLSKKAMVVSPDALDHLRKFRVVDKADGCCRPDGGTCCPNAPAPPPPKLERVTTRVRRPAV
jgi:hypothetical protein